VGDRAVSRNRQWGINLRLLTNLSHQVFTGGNMFRYQEMKMMAEFHEKILLKIKREIYIAELKVMVRWWPSQTTSLYHTTETPCGYVHEPANYRVMHQWQARDLGLRPCAACPWDHYENIVGEWSEPDAA
jgi:hypothetical protein